MQRIFNKDGFNWWIGVVEDRNDPEKMGRCKVRIFGYHTEVKEVLDTKDLPWAIPIQPITSAATSGKGSSPLGPLPGTWVLGFFLDGTDMQQPAMLGTIASSTVTSGFEETPDPEYNTNPNDGVLRDGTGKEVLDEKGEPVRSGTPDIPGWKLGQTSEKYEVGSGGPGTINDYNGAAAGDFGGASYGIYQMYSGLPVSSPRLSKPRDGSGGTVKSYVRDPNCKFRDKFAGLTPATPEFDRAWRACASSNAAAFREDQHDFIERTIYNKAVNILKRLQLCDVDKYGPAVKDLVWSTAVQWGPDRIDDAFRILADKSVITEREIVDLVTQHKISLIPRMFARSSEATKTGVRNRYIAEKADLYKLIKS
jgi:hypothetical protein